MDVAEHKETSFPLGEVKSERPAASMDCNGQTSELKGKSHISMSSIGPNDGEEAKLASRLIG